MRQQDLERERQCFDLLREVQGEEVVLIGGHAVSAYGPPRFSVDLDLVIPEALAHEIQETLRERKFKPVKRWKNDVFSGRFEHWTYGTGVLPTSVDLFIDAISDRVSGVTRKYEELRESSLRLAIRGLEPLSTAEALVPSREMLVVLKLQVGRQVDLRDIAVLADRPLSKERLKEILSPVPREVVRKHSEALLSALETVIFRNSLKGVYMLDDRAYERYTRGARELCLWLLREMGG